MEYTHQTVRDYVEAKRRGDTKTTRRILDEVQARFATRATDGTEMAQLFDAAWNTPLGQAEEA